MSAADAIFYLGATATIAGLAYLAATSDVNAQRIPFSWKRWFAWVGAFVGLGLLAVSLL